MTSNIRYLSCAETAKLVRQALKLAFPKIKFTVKSDTYSGGASIRVGWLDGPTTHDVEAVAGKFAGATFDGMIDLKSYHTTDLDGERVHMGADFVFCNRGFSPEFLRRRARIVAEKYRVELVEVTDSGELKGGNTPWAIGGRDTVKDLVMQVARKTRVA